MTNWIDPDATRPFDMGPCRCPVAPGSPQPHVNDSADIVIRFPYGDRTKIYAATGGQKNIIAILLGVKRWTLVLPDGRERPVDARQVHLLDEPTVTRLVSDDGLGAAMEDEPLPKVSAARSRGGGRAKSSSTPTPLRQPRSMTG